MECVGRPLHCTSLREYGDILGPLNADCAVLVGQALIDPTSGVRCAAVARRTYRALVNLRATCRRLRHLVEISLEKVRYILYFSWFISQRPYPINIKITICGASNIWFQEILATVRTELFPHCSFCGRKPAPVYARFCRRVCGFCYPTKVIPYSSVRQEYGLSDKQISRLKYIVPFCTMSMHIVRIQRNAHLFRSVPRLRPAEDMFVEESTVLLFMRDDVEDNLFRL